jgi:aminoglycoside phosphotransferase (APT) family kinase protein
VDTANLWKSINATEPTSLNEVVQPSLVHGDLWLKNILIERGEDKTKISAVLDAERAFWGEPAAEWIFPFFDIPDAFWSQYGHLPTGRAAEIRNRIYEGRGAIQVCLEAWRFHFDDGFARRILQQTVAALETG